MHKRLLQNSKFSEGFTLLELLVVMSILLVTAGMIYPQISLRQDSLKLQAQKVALFLKKVVQQNLYYKRSFKLSLDLKHKLLKEDSTGKPIEISLPSLKEVKSLTRGVLNSDAQVEFLISRRYGLEPLSLVLENGQSAWQIEWNPFFRRIKLNEISE